MLKLNGYRDFEVVHEGHQNLIYHAVRKTDDKSVIVKIIRSDNPSANDIARLYHEFEVTNDNKLSGVIQSYDIVHEENHYALIQEDMGGIPLSVYIREHPITSLDDFYVIAEQMIDIIEEVHKHHIIHKDIKPENFIIDPTTKNVKLTDFYFSSLLNHESQELAPIEKLEGTLSYISPEQTGRMNMNIDYRTDYYSLGVCLYELLVGDVPFEFTDPLELIHAHLAISAPNASKVNPNISLSLAKVIQKLMSKNPANRYQSTKGIKSDLHRCKTIGNQTFELGEADSLGKLTLSEKLYGRDDQIASLLAAYDRVAQGDREILMVYGFSGIGKTMLINELHKPMSEYKGYFIKGKFDQLQRDTPYTAVSQALNQLAQEILCEPEERFEQLKKNMLDTLGSVAQVVIDLAPDFELIFGPQPELEQLSPTETQNRMMIFFIRFLRVIATEEHPLVIFIDDMQWIDSGSLKLLEYIVKDDQLRHFFLIGSYRDNEVDEHHPLFRFFTEMSIKEKEINKIKLIPLKKIDIANFLADSFSRDKDSVNELAELLFKRTEGNPFFCKQLINTIHKKNLIFYAHHKKLWEWNLEAINELRITDNVVDLMVSKIEKLPDKTRKLLKYAACIGTKFSLETLSIVSKFSLTDIRKAIWPALENDLIFTDQLGYKKFDTLNEEKTISDLLKKIIYSFSHDRIQQAVYQSISKSEKEKTHISIARLLCSNTNKKNQKSSLFEMTDHFNQAHQLISEEERYHVAELNYQSGTNAERANAYTPMHRYLKLGLSLTHDDWWEKHYDLMFDLSKSYAQSLYLTGDLETSIAFSEQILSKAKNNIDKAKIYRLQCIQYTTSGEIQQSIKVGIKALNLLGVDITFKPSAFKIRLKYYQLQWQMRRISIDDFDKDLKDVTDPKILLAFDIIWELWSLVFVDQATNHYITLIGMELMIRHGIPPSASLRLAHYANYVFVMQNDLKKAKSIWKMAEYFMEKSNNKSVSSITIAIFNLYLSPLCYSYGELVKLAEKGQQLALESGNLLFAAISVSGKTTYTIHQRLSLSDELKLMKSCSSYCDRFQFKDGKRIWDAKTKIAEAIDNSVYLTPVYDGENELYRNVEYQCIAEYLTWAQMYDSAYIEHQRWLKNKQILRHYHGNIPTEASLAITLAKLTQNTSVFKKIKYLRIYKRILRNIEWASQNNPINYRHLELALSATLASLKNKNIKALKLYDKAIKQCTDIDNQLWLGVINELAAEHCGRLSLIESQKNYIRKAHYSYLRYGHTFKVRNLEQHYSSILTNYSSRLQQTNDTQSTIQDKTTAIETTYASLDYMSVIKSSQAISGEIKIDQLVEKLLHISIENAGAEFALFIEREKNDWEVVAMIDEHEGEKVFEMIGSSLDDYEKIPHNVIKYCLRTKKPLVLENAAQDSLYQTDPYIKQTQPKSILCLPVVLHNTVLGIIYLENNLTVSAFSKNQITVLTTLVSQIAISLENARHLEHTEQLYKSTERFIPKPFLRLIRKKNIEEVQRGDSVERKITILFNDIRSFTSLVEKRTPQDAFSFVNRYWEFMAPIIRKHHGYIDQYQGDAILAIFPRNADDGVRAAIEMAETLQRFNKHQKKIGDVEIEMGIGLSTGQAMLGIIGESERQVSGIISDVANTASRIEGLNKIFHTKILVDSETIKTLSPDLLVRKIDNAKLKGKEQATEIFQVFTKEIYTDEITHQNYINLFEDAFNKYTQGDFNEAKKIFKKCLDHYNTDDVAKVLYNRCNELSKIGIDNEWDGVYTFKNK